MPWQVYQPNPANLTTGDCVIRAICAVTGLSWDATHRVLSAYSRELADMPAENRVWWQFLRGIGFRRFQLPETCPDCYTVRDFARDHPEGKYIVGPPQHAVAVIDGSWWDAWDSGSTVPIYFFEEDIDHGVESELLPGELPANVSAISDYAATAAAASADADGGGCASPE